MVQVQHVQVVIVDAATSGGNTTALGYTGIGGEVEEVLQVVQMQKWRLLEAVAHKESRASRTGGSRHQDKEIMVVMVTTLQVAAAGGKGGASKNGNVRGTSLGGNGGSGGDNDYETGSNKTCSNGGGGGNENSVYSVRHLLVVLAV